jgi:4-hydroxy-tetrahydrodipicolinate reductase
VGRRAVGRSTQSVIAGEEQHQKAVIRVTIAGITGWMGRPLAAAIAEAPDMTLVSGVSRSAAGQRLSVAGATPHALIFGNVADALRAAPADVVVDFTGAAAVRDVVWTAVRAGVHVVVGSSGLGATDYQELDTLARDKGVGVIAAGNFSLMAALLRRAAVAAARHLSSWEIIDYASSTKPDVPSGTSRDLAEAMGAVRPPDPGLGPPDLHGPAEARGAEIAGTRIHSVRLPGFVVSTEVVFGAPGERLVMRHDPGDSPQPYVDGVLLAVRHVAEQAGVRRGLDSLL